MGKKDIKLLLIALALDVHHSEELQKRLDAVRVPQWACSHSRVERQDYLNPCASAACKLGGQHAYHLGCGSQYREICDDCGQVLFDSAQDEIDNAEWAEIEYRCADCAGEVQIGHFACGETFRVPA